jgi:hypothetical protein
MATQSSSDPLRFRGTPLLVEGLAPFPHQKVVAGTAVSVVLASQKTAALGVSSIQTMPAGDAATWIRFSLPPATLAGSYSGEVSFGHSAYPIMVEVEGKSQLHLSPPRLNLSAAPGSSIAVEMTVANGGNVAVEVPSVSGFGLFDIHGAEQSIASAFRTPAQTGQERFNHLVDSMANQHGGLARIKIEEGSGLLTPGGFRNLKLVIRIPDAVKPGRTYSGTWAVANLRYPMRVAVPTGPVSVPSADGKEAQ